MNGISSHFDYFTERENSLNIGKQLFSFSLLFLIYWKNHNYIVYISGKSDKLFEMLPKIILISQRK